MMKGAFLCCLGNRGFFAIHLLIEEQVRQQAGLLEFQSLSLQFFWHLSRFEVFASLASSLH